MMEHVRVWLWALAVTFMGYLALCLAWPGEHGVEFDMACCERDDVVPSSALGWMEDIDLGASIWTGEWTVIEDTLGCAMFEATTPMGRHLLTMEQVWDEQGGCRLHGEWTITAMPLHCRGLGILFGIRHQMQDQLRAGLQSWEQKAPVL